MQPEKRYLVPSSISPVLDPYKYMQDLGVESRTDGIEDLFNLKFEQAQHRIDIVIGEIMEAKEAYQVNFRELEMELMNIGNLISRMPIDKKYYTSREFVDLHKEKFAVRRQMREERHKLIQNTARLRQELRDALIERFAEEKKSKVFEIAGEEKDDERREG